MSTVQSPETSSASNTGSGILTGVKITTSILALGVLIQAWLGSSGFFQNESALTTGHGHLGNSLFLIAGIQVGLALFGAQKGRFDRTFVVTSIVGLGLIVAQIGLGYSTRSSVDALTWHLPNGVLLMAVSTWNVILAWSRPRDRT